MTATSDLIDSLVSYAWNDWMVSRQEMLRAATALRADAAIDRTVQDLEASGGLARLLSRVDDPALLRQVVAVLASRTSSSSGIARAKLVAVKPLNPVLTRTGAWSGFGPEVFFDVCKGLGSASVAHGFPAATAPTGPPGAPPADASGPFTGVGATGVNPSELSIDVIDKALLAAGHGPTEARYSNPIPGSLSAYLTGLTPRERLAQARTLVRQPISTLFPHAYRGAPPSRARVMWAAGRQHSLEPELVAGFILAEQRDQSRREDAKDYIAATSILKGNTSIGLGQVVVSTARNSDLFEDLLAAGVRGALSHREIATLLISDEFNIFATARYIRKVADRAARLPIATLPNTQSFYPGIEMRAFARSSASWPTDNVRALASEYTSRAWDDRLVPAWGEFVESAVHTLKRSGLTFP